MLKSFLLISIRHLLRKAGTSLINIICLSTGGAICIFIFSLLRYENNYDQSFPHPHTYRLETHLSSEGGPVAKDAYTSSTQIAEVLREQNFDENFTRLIPYSEEGSGFFRRTKADGSSERRYFKQVFYAEENVDLVFGLKWVSRLPDLPAHPYAMYLSESLAEKIFGKDDLLRAIGTNIEATQNNGQLNPEYVIAGIYEDLPSNTHIELNVLVLSGIESSPFLLNNDAYTYLYVPSPLRYESRVITSDLMA